MPQYYVYDKNTGLIVHQHETYDGLRNASVACSTEEVLSLVDIALARETLDVLEVGDDLRTVEARGDIRIDPSTRQFTYGADIDSG